MREILFRGKRIDNGEWVEGLYTENCISYASGFAIIEDYYEKYEVKRDTVGQYSGLTDKNGKKIFEGDICKFREWDKGDMCWIGKVHYEHQQFVISGGPNEECATTFTLCMSRFIPENIEVIGNVYDNPELLEVK